MRVREERGLEKKGVAGAGFEPCNQPCNVNHLQDQAHKEAHNAFSDPDLARVVTVWPSLSPAIKAAINALVNHQP
jgi:hypothetical protein